jgi:hypothetical protein
MFPYLPTAPPQGPSPLTQEPLKDRKIQPQHMLTTVPSTKLVVFKFKKKILKGHRGVNILQILHTCMHMEK